MSRMLRWPGRAVAWFWGVLSLRRLILTVLILAAAGGAAAFLIIRSEVFETEEAPPPVTAAVERRDVVSSLATIGNVEFSNIVELEFGQSGTLQALNVDVGELVTSGTVLAKLNVSDLERTVADAASDLKQAEWQLERLLRPTRSGRHRARRVGRPGSESGARRPPCPGRHRDGRRR